MSPLPGREACPACVHWKLDQQQTAGGTCRGRCSLTSPSISTLWVRNDIKNWNFDGYNVTIVPRTKWPWVVGSHWKLWERKIERKLQRKIICQWSFRMWSFRDHSDNGFFFFYVPFQHQRGYHPLCYFYISTSHNE